MPITPRFGIEQDDAFIRVVIRTPHVRVSEETCECDIDPESNTFSFFLAPYLLKLTFPGAIVDDERTRAVYDAAAQTVTVWLAKGAPGIMRGLDLITTLLQPRQHPTASTSASGASVDVDLSYLKATADDDDTAASAMSRLSLHPTDSDVTSRPSLRRRPLIEVLDSTPAEVEVHHDDPTHGEEVTQHISLPADGATVQVTPDTASAAAAVRISPTPAATVSSVVSPIGYGFARHHVGVFKDLEPEGVVDLPSPDLTPAPLRPFLRMCAAAGDFNTLHYINDALESDDPTLDEFLGTTPPFLSPFTGWDELELQALTALPRLELFMDGQPLVVGASEGVQVDWAARPDTTRAATSLIALLSAAVYDIRFNGGEAGVESAWDVASLAPPLSWLDDDCITSQAEVLHALRDATDLKAALESREEGDASPAGIAVRVVRGLPATPGDITPRVRFTANAAAFIAAVLTRPYLRRFDLAMICLRDTMSLLSLGTLNCLRVCLSLRRIMAGDEERYVFNSLLLDEMCVWLQCVHPNVLADAARMLAEVVDSMTPRHASLAFMRLAEAQQQLEGASGAGYRGTLGDDFVPEEADDDWEDRARADSTEGVE